MDNTEHYGCFDKGSNPLGTSLLGGLAEWSKATVCKTVQSLVQIQHSPRWLWSNGKTGVCGTSNKSSILFNHTIYCGEEGFPTGLISRVSRVRFSAPQQNIFKGIFLLKKLYLYLFQDNGFHHSTDVDNPEWSLKT